MMPSPSFHPRFGAAAAAVAIAAVTIGASALAENWPGPRGPSHDGSGDDSAPLPADFSATRNVKWSVEMAGPSSATPAVWGDRVFLTSAIEESEELAAVCLDRRTGNEVWKKTLSPGFRIDDRSNLASPSPVTDGRHVAWFFGNGLLVVTDLDGEELWRKNVIGSDDYYFAFLWTFSTSPLLHDGKIYMQVLQRDESFEAFGKQRGQPGGNNDSFIAAYEVASGKELFKVVRPSKAVAESREAFTTPVPAKVKGKDAILVAGGDDLTAHDAQTGEEMWRWGTWNNERIGHWRLVPSPVAGGGVAVVCAPKGAPVYGIDLDTGKLLWQSEDKAVSSDVATPAFYRGYFWVLNGDRQSISCVEPKTGKVVGTLDLESRAKIEASPTAADGKLYFMDHNATVFVVSADPSDMKVLSRVELGSRREKNNRSSVAVAGGRLFIRTNDTLYCVGN